MRRFLIALSLGFAATAVQAVPLPPGDNPLPGTTLAAEPQLAGVALVDELQPFSITGSTGTFSGVIQNRVVRSSVDGTIDFYWRIRDTVYNGTPGAAPLRVTSFRIGDFGSSLFASNGNYRTDGLGDVGPDTARVFADPDGFVNFLFSDGLSATDESLFFFIDTSATSFAKTAIYDLTSTEGGAISISYATYAPAIPEPATWAMLILGFGLLGASTRRPRTTRQAA